MSIVTFQNGGRLITRGSSLPELPATIENLFLDFETTSGDKDKASTNPWHFCKLMGAAFKWDDEKHAYYIPVRSRLPSDINRNYSLEAVHLFLSKLISRSKNWINHNIKYDANVLRLSCGIDVLDFDTVLQCTLTLAKIVDSDRWKYDLDSLSHDLLFKNISHYKHAFLPYTKKGRNTINKDWGNIPMELMAEYACQDVLTNEELFYHLIEECPCPLIWNLEKRVTRSLLKIERRGILLDGIRAVRDCLGFPKEIGRCEIQIREIVGQKILPNKNADCLKLFCSILGLPVVDYTDETEYGGGGEPSFGKQALTTYKYMRPTRCGITEENYLLLLDLVHKYKELHKLHSSFTKSFLKRATGEGRIHGSFNQCVRTGRTSQTDPNMQQNSKKAKEYFIPSPGYCFVERDLKQIEPRITAHYIKNDAILKKYREDKSTDYYTVTMEQCKIERAPAKAVYLAFTYGAGKPKLADMIKQNIELEGMTSLKDFEDRCTALANYTFEATKKSMPELKNTAYKAQKTLRTRIREKLTWTDS